MTDIKSPEERSKNMSAIKRADTKPEIYIRKMLFRAGYRFRIQTNIIPGHPDLWMKKYNVAIFVHGCFWHRHTGCSYAYMPKSRVDFWSDKFRKNMQRDSLVRQQLREKNVRCLVIWECTIKQVQKKNGDPDILMKEIESFLMSDRFYQEI